MKLGEWYKTSDHCKMEKSSYCLFVIMQSHILYKNNQVLIHILQGSFIHVPKLVDIESSWTLAKGHFQAYYNWSWFNGSLLAKLKVFLSCYRHEINMVEAVGLKHYNYTWQITIFVKMWNLGQFHEKLIYCQ